MKPITYKQVLDGQGFFEALEIHQGDNMITISLSISSEEGTANHRWDAIKKTIDRIQARVNKGLIDDITEQY